MAQQTALSVSAIPGPIHSFIAKTAAAIGPALFNLVVAQSQVDGATEGESYLDGAVVVQSRADGTVASQSEPT